MAAHFRYLTTCSILVAVTVAACAPITTRLTAPEKKIGTANKGDWLLHRLPEEPHGLGLKVPGYIIGFEKTKRVTKLDLPKLSECGAAGECDARWARYGVRKTEDVNGLDQYSNDCRTLLLERRNNKVADGLSDREQAFLSHVVRYSYRER